MNCPSCLGSFTKTKDSTSFGLDTSALWDKTKKVEKLKSVCPLCGFLIEEKDKEEQDKKI